MLDEGIGSKPLQELLRQQGYRFVLSKEEFGESTLDVDLLRAISSRRMVLVTKDSAMTRRAKRRSSSGGRARRSCSSPGRRSAA